MKKRILSIVLAIVMLVGVLPISAIAAIGEDGKHVCDAPGEYCLVCDVAEKINSLPAKDNINVENAAMVIENIHAIDRIKFDLTNEEYEELLTLVEVNTEGPMRYFDAVDKIKALGEDGSFIVIDKVFLSKNDDVNVDGAVVEFRLTNLNTETSQTLTMSAMPDMFGTLSADPDFYSENPDGSGWSYKYILPAGSYEIEEISDSGATVDGEPFVTGSTSYSIDGSEETEGKTATFTVGEDGNTEVAFYNVFSPVITFKPSEDSETSIPMQMEYGATLTLPECFFDAPAENMGFKAWEINGTEYKAGETFTITGNTTATAIWETLFGNIKISVNPMAGISEDHEIPFTIKLYDVSVNGTYGEIEFTDSSAEFSLNVGESIEITGLPYLVSYKIFTIEDDGVVHLTGAIEFEGSAVVHSEAIFTFVPVPYSVILMHGNEEFASAACPAGSNPGFTIGLLPPVTNVPEGHEFLGWCTTDNIWVNILMTVDKDLTAYSVWNTPAEITGEPKVGKTLTAEVTITPSNENVPVTLNYQWKRNGEEISGATNKTYVPTEEDVGYELTCEIDTGAARKLQCTTETIEAGANDSFKVTVLNGGSDKAEYEEGETVTITADRIFGKKFVGWTSEDGVVFENAKNSATTFTMPAKGVSVKANYVRIFSGGNNRPAASETPKTEEAPEANPNTGAPVLLPAAAVLAILSGAVVFKRK